MKITKLIHSCLLVEMPGPINRTALFDPGVMSESAVDVDALEYLDDIIITHEHTDHLSVPLIRKLLVKFPDVRITAPTAVVEKLKQDDILATSKEFEGVEFFDSPHESIKPLGPQPDEIGVHYLDLLTYPGDSHSFQGTKPILALPMQGPWGSAVRAINLALELKPKYVVPIHDWHWRDEAREQLYSRFEQVFWDNGITFLPMKTGEPVVVDV